jgi:hypothetical protein
MRIHGGDSGGGGGGVVDACGTILFGLRPMMAGGKMI